jgi:hypothetical protein
VPQITFINCVVYALFCSRERELVCVFAGFLYPLTLALSPMAGGEGTIFISLSLG